MEPQQFRLKWNSYSSNLAITFSNLFKSDLLADVTLSCDGTVFKAHKLILAACSKKFADLFETTPTHGQCLVILEATSSENMAALLEFMYKGEVHVSQEALNSFLKSAENLQVKGLSTETGPLVTQPPPQQQQHMPGTSPLDSPTARRSILSGLNGGDASGSGSGSGLSSSSGSLGNAVPSGVIGVTGNLMPNTQNTSGNVSGGVSNNINSTSNAPGATSNMGGPVGGNTGSTGNLKQECDSMLHASNSSLASMSNYVPPPIYHRPMSFEPLRKRALRSPYAEQEVRGSVLRDGSKNSSECASPVSKPPYHRPSSSASSTAPTEADTLHSERASPQSSRYENHSPSTTAGNSNTANSNLDRLVKTERNNGSPNAIHDDERDDHDESMDNGAEDLRVKSENSNYSPPPAPTSNTSPTTPTALLENLKNSEGGLSGTLASSIAPADMLNVWNATKLNNKNNSMVNTADGKKMKCLYCDRLYGYETNLRAHIRQRHQGIRVPCPFCTRTFTRNNTVRRHIAREHKAEIGISAGSTIAPASVISAAAAAAATTAAAAAANHAE